MRLTSTCLSLAATVLVVGLLPAVPAQASAGPRPERLAARGFETEDGYYCRYERGTQGAVKYVKSGKRQREWVPIGEIHTGSNTKGHFLVGSKISTALSGGVTVNAGKSWSVGVSLGSTKSYTVDVTMRTLAPLSHKQVQSRYDYQKYRIYCGNRDPRTGIISYAASPKYRYLPLGWSGNVRYRDVSATGMPSCKGRGSVPDHKIALPHGQMKRVGWSHEYSASVTLTGIGVGGTFTSSTGSSKAVEFWTTKGKAWICGDSSSIQDSTRFYANNY